MSESRKIAAILVSDIVGFSRLAGSDEDRLLARLRALRSDLIDPIIAVHRGRVVKRTGDGALVEFRSVVDAVRCAIEVQNGMIERNAGLPPERRIEFRMGIHLGDVVEENDGDLMGDGVNIAARLEGVAQPGAICLSEDAYRQVSGRLDMAVADLGPTQLKNIERPIRVYSLQVGQPAEAKPAKAAPARKRRAGPAPVLGIVALVALACAAGWVGWTKFGGGSAEVSGVWKGARVAVLAFDNLSGDPALNSFADGISEQVITNLAGYGVYDVLTRNATFAFKGKAADAAEIRKKLGADYVVEGSVRRAGEKLIVTAKLIHAADAAQVWAQTFEEPGAAASLGEVLDRLAQRIGIYVGDLYISYLLTDNVVRNRDKPAEALTPFECLAAQKYDTPDPKDTARVRTCLDLAVKREPRNAIAWSSLSLHLIRQLYTGFGLPPAEANDLDKRAYLLPLAEQAAERSVSLSMGVGPYSHLAMARVAVYKCQRDKLRSEADRLFALNPNDAEAMGLLGHLLARTGDWEYGRSLGDKALALVGSSSPAFWHWTPSDYLFRKGDYEGAYKALLPALSEDWWHSMLRAAAILAYLDRTEEAKALIPKMIKQQPEMSLSFVRKFYKLACFEEDFIARTEAGLRKVGLRETADEAAKAEVAKP